MGTVGTAWVKLGDAEKGWCAPRAAAAAAEGWLLAMMGLPDTTDDMGFGRYGSVWPFGGD